LTTTQSECERADMRKTLAAPARDHSLMYGERGF
jgi:hypothetical protein